MKEVMPIGYLKVVTTLHTSIKLQMVEKEKNNKLTLEKDGQTIEGDDNLLQHATKYYADLFGPTSEHEIQMDQET